MLYNDDSIPHFFEFVDGDDCFFDFSGIKPNSWFIQNIDDPCEFISELFCES